MHRRLRFGDNVLALPLLPFVGFLVNAFLGRRLPKAVSGSLATGLMALSFVISVMQVLALMGMPSESRQITQTLYTWMTAGDFTLDFALRLDALSAVMILVVTGIGTLIHLYSTAYMHEESDWDYARFFSYLNLFCFFMLVLVLGSNVLVMFVGWEGVGLCSYLLIGFYYVKPSASGCREEGVRGQPHRRLRVHPRHAAAGGDVQFAGLHHHCARGEADAG